MKPRALCLGPEGSFTDQASRQIFGESVQRHYSRSMQEMTVMKPQFEKHDFVLMPLFNSNEIPVETFLNELAGDIRDRGFEQSRYVIKAASFLPVKLSLLSHPSTKTLSDIKIVASHPKALEQISLWRKSFPDKKYVGVNSTSDAARYAGECKSVGAVASNICADIYNLNVICEDIHDNESSKTFIAVFGRRDIEPELSYAELVEYAISTAELQLRVMFIAALNVVSPKAISLADIKRGLYDLIASIGDLALLHTIIVSRGSEWHVHCDERLDLLPEVPGDPSPDNMCLAIFEICPLGDKDGSSLDFLDRNTDGASDSDSSIVFVGPFPVYEADRSLDNIRGSNLPSRLLDYFRKKDISAG